MPRFHPLRRCLVTGSSGFLGSRLVAGLASRGVEVLGIDCRPPRSALASPLRPHRFERLDIRDTQLGDLLACFAPDTVIHAAFAVQPLRDERLAEAIDVGGTRNLLAAVAAARTSRLLVVSSATAYGAWPDNPLPLHESHPRRRCEAFRYAADKHAVELLLERFSRDEPAIATSWVRPAIIGGATADSFVLRFLLGAPLLAKFDGIDLPLQMVHETDVVAGILAVLEADGRGAYNLAPPDWMRISEIARETDRPAIAMPLWLGKMIHTIGWHLRSPLHEAPAGFLEFARHPWVVAPQRLTGELGFRFGFTSLETLRTMTAP